MSTFQEQINNIKDGQQNKQFRLNKISEIENITKRPLIVYATAITKGGPNGIDLSDITGFSDLIEGIKSKTLDVLLHSPGGSAEATERIVKLLRKNFEDIRFLIPHSAYSAATMLALSGNSILMDDRSSLGPIDPQIKIGNNFVAAQDILDGFEETRKILKKEGVKSLPIYMPLLNKYDLHTFELCKKAQELAKKLVIEWMKKYMFSKEKNPAKKTNSIANFLSSRSIHLSHSRTIDIDDAQKKGLIIEDSRKNPSLRNTLWNLLCSIELYFDRSTAVKLFENNKGVSWSKSLQVQRIMPIFPMGPQSPAPLPPKPSQQS